MGLDWEKDGLNGLGSTHHYMAPVRHQSAPSIPTGDGSPGPVYGDPTPPERAPRPIHYPGCVLIQAGGSHQRIEPPPAQPAR